VVCPYFSIRQHILVCPYFSIELCADISGLGLGEAQARLQDGVPEIAVPVSGQDTDQLEIR